MRARTGLLDERIPKYIAATEQLKLGNFDVDIPLIPPDEIGHLGTALRESKSTRLMVHNGPGIVPEDRSRLFQEFVRLSARPTGGEASTGLGLAITRRIIESHGGEIGVVSEPGQGATFWFSLPAVAD